MRSVVQCQTRPPSSIPGFHRHEAGSGYLALVPLTSSAFLATAGFSSSSFRNGARRSRNRPFPPPLSPEVPLSAAAVLGAEHQFPDSLACAIGRRHSRRRQGQGRRECDREQENRDRIEDQASSRTRRRPRRERGPWAFTHAYQPLHTRDFSITHSRRRSPTGRRRQPSRRLLPAGSLASAPFPGFWVVRW